MHLLLPDSPRTFVCPVRVEEFWGASLALQATSEPLRTSSPFPSLVTLPSFLPSCPHSHPGRTAAGSPPQMRPTCLVRWAGFVKQAQLAISESGFYSVTTVSKGNLCSVLSVPR